MNTRQISVHDRDLYAVSTLGGVQLREAGTTLLVGDLKLLVLIDGKTTVGRIAERLGTPLEEVKAAFADLRRRGLIESTRAELLTGIGDYFSLPLAPGAGEGVSQNAGQEISSGVTALGSAGYYVTIAQRAAKPRALEDGDNHTVLVIDDDPGITTLTGRYLERAEFIPRIASNREEIIAALRRLPVASLILLDVMMPDADGFDILAKIRNHPVLQTIPVIMMTALATRDAVLKGLQLGADGYVTKPFEQKVLMKAVRTVLGLTQVGKADAQD